MSLGREKARMLAGEEFIPRDPALAVDHARAQELLEEFNGTAHREHARRRRLLEELFAEFGAAAEVKPPLRCDYGWLIKVGEETFVNTGCVFLDAAPITIGPRCQIGPGVQILTVDHPLDPASRRQGLEVARRVTIEENVWIAAGVIICAGVTIGADSVVGAGSVVTRDIPAGVVAHGVPARVDRSAHGEGAESPTA
jgi:maltose O-acetyltransferase